MNTRTLVFRGLSVFAALAAIPHLFAFVNEYGAEDSTHFLMKILSEEVVEYGFNLANDGSLFYIIIPFFLVELLRYTFLRRMSWNLVGDSIANVVTLVAFLGIEVMLGLLFLYQLYFWVYQNLSLPTLPLNLITIISCILLADFAQYWDKNYAGILIIWDRLFGTFEEEREEVRYGVSEPIDSVNPLVVFFHGFTRLFQKISQAKGLKNKLLYLIKPPGWQADE